MTGFSQLGNGAFSIRPFWYAFNKRGFYLITELFFEHQSALVMGVCPAVITRWPDVDKANLHFVCGNLGNGAEAQQHGEHYCG